MLQLRDKRAKRWLSLIRPIVLILLPIGQCMAQETDLKVDMVGLLRRKVQVVMRDYSFSEYKKDHVTYVLDPTISQRINYTADTCSSIEFYVKLSSSDAFEKRLSLSTNSVGADFQKKVVNDKTQFTITKRVKPKAVVQKKKRVKNRLESKLVELPSKERVAADEGYFKVQKRKEADNESHVKVLGWNKSKGQ